MSVEPEHIWCPPHAEHRSVCRRRVCQDLGVAYELGLEVSVPSPVVFLMRWWPKDRQAVVSLYHGGISINILTCKLNTSWAHDAHFMLRQSSGIDKILPDTVSLSSFPNCGTSESSCDVTEGNWATALPSDLNAPGRCWPSPLRKPGDASLPSQRFLLQKAPGPPSSPPRRST